MLCRNFTVRTWYVLPFIFMISMSLNRAISGAASIREASTIIHERSRTFCSSVITMNFHTCTALPEKWVYTLFPAPVCYFCLSLKKSHREIGQNKKIDQGHAMEAHMTRMTCYKISPNLAVYINRLAACGISKIVHSWSVPWYNYFPASTFIAEVVYALCLILLKVYEQQGFLKISKRDVKKVRIE